ncbi:hypothetical protein CMK12_01200 [Candidatus Poribacteria bacterium]|nr:hypothetical protein [Candidatus Poribacteria bacterium]
MTTRIDLAVDGLGNPLGSILTAGQDSNIIQGLNPEMVIADKAYEAKSYFKTKDNLNLPISRSQV